MITSTTAQSVTPIKPTPVPGPPVPGPEILATADAPLFTGSYAATERDSWRDGLPLVGRKVSSSRGVSFSNEFNVLRTGNGPMISFASTTFDDAVRAAQQLTVDWADPAFGGAIYASVGAAVLQAKDGNYFVALVGSGDPRTSASELGYRSDRFDGDIYGELKRAKDSKATSSWSAPVDKDGHPVDLPAPDDARAIRRRDVEDVEITEFVPHSPTLKAIVDLRNVFVVEQPTSE